MREVMKQYYAQRAENYEDVYDDEEREDDLDELAEQVEIALTNHDVLELACGTGFWTEQYAVSAKSVYATDINMCMLEIAGAKDYPDDVVEFALADAFALTPIADRKFTACFAGFLWSHVKREEYAKVLASIRAATGAGAHLVLIDNNMMEEGNVPTARTDSEGNTYQLREQNGAPRVEILKNYPTDSYMKKQFAKVARDIRISRNEYYWMLTCTLK